MRRRKRAVGLIKCPTDVSTINAIVEAGGLTAEPADQPGHFYLLNSGRNLASEVEPELYAAAAHRLDSAVRNGIIPAWSSIENAGKHRTNGHHAAGPHLT